MYEDQTHPAEI